MTILNWKPVMATAYERNSQWAKKGPHITALSAENERRFRSWLKNNSGRVGEFDPDNARADYDMRGWWMENKGATAPDGHFPDTYKTPYHQSFSNESKYAEPDKAPQWHQQGSNWLLIDLNGNVLVSE